MGGAVPFPAEWTPQGAMWWFCRQDDALYEGMELVLIQGASERAASESSGVDRRRLAEAVRRFRVMAGEER